MPILVSGSRGGGDRAHGPRHRRGSDERIRGRRRRRPPSDRREGDEAGHAVRPCTSAESGSVEARESGSVDDPACARPYYHGDGSLLLSADGTVVSATGERWRVVVFEAGTREATVWEYEAELVANPEAQLRRELARDVSVLSAAEREHVEAAAEEGGTLVPPGRMASGEAPAFVGLLRTSGFRFLEDPGDAYGVLQWTYVTYDGRVYVVEFRYRSGERSRGNERPRASVG